MIRARHARIVSTLGPATRGADKVLSLARAGADVFRLNFSHGSHDDHAAAFVDVRAAEAMVERPLAVLADLQGPKFRLGAFSGGRIEVAPGVRIRLDLDPSPGDARRVSMPHPELFAALKVGSQLLIDDGRVRLTMIQVGADFADAEVMQGDSLSDRKGVALPGAIIPLSPLTPKDRQDLAFALRLGVDWVALSFVQRAADMAELRRLVEGKAAVMAKIEKPAALADLEPILDLCDGVMVARGDLGVELNPEDVPVAQKMIVRAARRRGLPVIVATQMLESMIEAPTPTRAEASDVANAVYEGADAVMLSAETASGKYPIEAVEMMHRIIARVERDPNWPSLMDAEHGGVEEADALVVAAHSAADSGATACLAVYTTTGMTARRLARERPLQPILALVSNADAARRLCLVWGVEPRLAEAPTGVDQMTEVAAAMAADLGLAEPNSRIWILAGTPFGSPGAANLLRLAHAPARKPV